MVLSHWLRNVRGFFAYTNYLKRHGIRRPQWKRRARRIQTVAAQTESLEKRTLLAGTIASAVWNDADGDGALDGGSETFRNDVTVHLVSVGADGVINGSGSEITGDDEIIATTTTAALNYARFDNQYGTFYLSYELPAGVTWTYRDNAGDTLDSDVGFNRKSHVFTLTPGGANEITVDAGVVPVANLTLEGDFNGDDRPDATSAADDLTAWLTAINLWDSDAVDEVWLNGSPSGLLNDVVVGDFNGDGRDDIADYLRRTGEGWHVLLSTGESFESRVWGAAHAVPQWEKLLVGDFDGDGRDDLAGFDSSTGSWHVFRSTGTVFESSIWDSWSTSTTWKDMLVADVTGDGRDDIVGRDSSTGDWSVGVSTGTGFQQSVWGNWNPSVDWTNVLAGDFNGDGNMDVAGQTPGAGGWYVATSSGSAFSTAGWANALISATDVAVVDVNKDRSDDIVGRSGGGWLVAVSNAPSAATFDEHDFGSDYFVETSVTPSATPSVTIVDFHYRFDATLDLFESVRNSIQFDPSKGRMKDATDTSFAERGNAWDQAGLLLSRLQDEYYDYYYDIESRLATGTVTAGVDEVMQWLGVTSADAAEAVLDTAGLSATLLSGNEQISFAHAWVEVKLAGEAGLEWRPLDPSWKARSYQPGIADVLADVKFDEKDFLAQSNPLPLEYFEDAVQAWLTTDVPGTSLADVAYTGEIIPEYYSTFPVVPDHLPSTGYSTYATMDDVPDTDTHRVRISIDYKENGTFEISEELRVDQIASSDILIRAVHDGSLWRPELAIFGSSFDPATGYSQAGSMLIKVEHFDPGTSSASAADRTIVTTLEHGQLATLNLNVRQMSARSLALSELYLSQSGVIPTSDTDEVGPGFYQRVLSLASTRYNVLFDQSIEAIAGLTQTIAVHPYVMSGFVVSEEDTLYNDDLPMKAVPKELHIDVPNPVFYLVPIDGTETFDSVEAQMRMYLAGYQASALEHYVLEALTHTEAVSAARGLQVATESATNDVFKFVKDGSDYIDLFTETAMNVGDVLNLGTLESDILGLLNDGYVVTVAEKPVTINSWTGPVFMKAKASATDFEFASLIDGDGQLIHGGQITSSTSSPIAPTVANTESIVAFASDKVNLANGNLFRDDLDLSLQNIGYPIMFQRHYDSESTDDFGMGVGWRYSFGDRLTFESEGTVEFARWVTSSGTDHIFEESSPDNWDAAVSLPGATFTKSGTSYVITERNGLKHTFDSLGRLYSIGDRNGNILVLAYAGSAMIPNLVRDMSSGTAVTRLTLIDSNSDGHIDVVEDYTGREWTYQYTADDGNQYLTRVDGPSDSTTEAQIFEYDYHFTTSTPAWQPGAEGLMFMVTEPGGRELRIEYYANRRVFRVHDGEGHKSSFTYDLYHNETQFFDENGVQTTYRFDDAGRILRKTNADRSRTLQTWEANAPQLLSSTDVFGQTESYVYDTSGNLEKITARDGIITEFEYDGAKFHQVKKVTVDPNPQSSGGEQITDYELDAKGNVTKIIQTVDIDAQQTIETRMTYTSNGLLESVTQPKEYVTNPDGDYTTMYAYNALGLVTSITLPDPDGAGPLSQPVQSFTYDSRGNLKTSTDPTGVVTTHTYDLLNRRVSTTLPDPDAAGPLKALVTTYAYSPANELVAVTDANGNRTEHTYDDKGRLITTRFADGTYRSLTYDGVGNLIASTDELGRETHVVYDARNRAVIAVAADGSYQRKDYDGGGRVANTWDANGNITSYEYDEVGRVTKVIDAMEEAFVTAYDVFGNIETTTDRRGKQTTYEYDDLNRVIEVRGPEGYITTTDYDENGNVVNQTRYDVTSLGTILDDPRDIATGSPQLLRATVIEYDALNRPVKWTNPDGKFREVAYDAAGRMTSSTDELGRTTNYLYDGIGRQYLVRLPDPDPTDGDPTRPETVTTFDAAGNVIAVTQKVSGTPGDTQVTQFDYDVRNRQVAQTDAEGGEWQTIHDVAGQVVISMDALGRLTRYEYDERGRMVRQVFPDPDGTGPQESPVITSTYDAVGNLLSSTDPLGRTTTYEYDELNRLETVTLPQDDPTHAAAVTTYTYNEEGNRLAAIESYGATDGSQTRQTTWTYDGQGRVLTETLPDPDGAGSLVKPSTTYTYDALGNLETVTDHLGRITTHEYDNLNRRTSTTLPDPDPGDTVTEHPKTEWQYDKVGNVTKITVYEDATTTRETVFEYDKLNRLVKETLPEPDADANDDRPVTEYVYDLVGNLVVLLEKRENGTFRETSYEYDKLNRRTKVTLPDPDGAGPLPAPTTEFTYDAVGNLTEVEDHLGRVTTSTYDALNRLIERKLPDPDLSDGVNRQPTTQWVYDAAGRLLELKELKDDDTFRVTTYTYDGWDRLLTETLPDPNPNDMVSENPVTTWEYDLSGNVLSVTDTLGRVTTYEYDALDRLTKETLPDPDGAGSLVAPFTETTYDNAGNVAQVEDHLGRLTVYEYDDLDRLIKQTLPEPDADGIDERPITQWTYDLLGNVLTITDPLGRVTTNEYDDLNRQSKEILPEPDNDGIDDRPITQWVYDRLGNVIEVIDAMGQSTTRQYDDLGRLTEEVMPDPDGGGSGVAPETVYVYDSAGNLISESNQLGETTTYTYDRLDRLILTTDPRSYDTQSTYDILGRQTSLTDAEGNQTTFAYDDLDRLTAETNELSDTRSYDYDLLGRLESLVDRNGRLTRYYYDNLDRLKLEVWWTGWGGSFVDSLSTTYNDAGLVANQTDYYGTFSYDYTYDDLDRLITRTESGSPSITWTYTYDKAGNLTKREDTAGFSNNYYRDDLGRVVRLTQVYGGSGKMVDYEYNTLGQVTRLTRYEDLAGTTVNSKTETTYDDTHRISVIYHKSAAGALLRRHIHTYDSASRLIRLDDLSGAYETHAYDDAGQLTGVDYTYQADESYSYDGTGNRTLAGYVTAANNQTTDDGTYTYQYDDEGNRTRKTTKSTGAYVEYAWDHRNRLTRVEFRTSGGTLTKAVEYDYDHADRRIARRVDDNADSTWDDLERFVYDGEDLTLVYDETGTPALEGRYLHGPGIDTVVAYWQPGVPKIRWTFTDRLGNVRDVVEINGSTVSVVEHQNYSSFGGITSDTNPSYEFRFGYTGRLWDADVGLQFNRARWYDPALGKFVSEDPLGFAAGDANLSRYVGNDPVNFTDPSGLFLDDIGEFFEDIGESIGQAYDDSEEWLEEQWQNPEVRAGVYVAAAVITAVVLQRYEQIPGWVKLSVSLATSSGSFSAEFSGDGSASGSDSSGGSDGLVIRGQSPDDSDAGIPIDSPLYVNYAAYDNPIYEQHSPDALFNPAYPTGSPLGFGSGPHDIFQNGPPPFVTSNSILDFRSEQTPRLIWRVGPNQDRTEVDLSGQIQSARESRSLLLHEKVLAEKRRWDAVDAQDAFYQDVVLPAARAHEYHNQMLEFRKWRAFQESPGWAAFTTFATHDNVVLLAAAAPFGIAAGAAGGVYGLGAFALGEGAEELVALYSGFPIPFAPGPDDLVDAFRHGARKATSLGTSHIDDYVDVTGHRSAHILNRHMFGAGKHGKTEFPASWTDQRILHEVSDVATDPNAFRGVGKWNSPYATGTRDGIPIRVDFYPPTHPTHAGKISTAYPLNVPANPN